MDMHIAKMGGRIMRKYGIIILIIIGLTGDFADIYGCSSVCLDKKGQLILGNNMDWILGDGMVVVNKRQVVKRGFWYKNKPDWTWTSKYGSITLTTEGREFPIRGMNEAGLVVVEMMLAETQHPPAGSLPVLSGSQWIQYQLDTSATVEEVIASDTVVRIEPTDWAGMASHFLICDKSGTIAGIEWLAGKMTVYTGDKLPIPAMVNSTYESCITNGDDPSGRFKPIANMYSAYNAAQTSDGVSYVFSILEAVADKLSLPFATRWRMAFDVRAMRLYWKTAENSHLRYVDFKDFDFSCRTNVEVLDINSSDAGNVRTAFVPYTVDFNRKLVTRTYSLYNQYSDYIGRQYSQDTIEGIIAFPESTICMSATDRKLDFHQQE
jgi:penicillin V acylase-like amidase (Ntn superfamily)